MPLLILAAWIAISLAFAGFGRPWRESLVFGFGLVTALTLLFTEGLTALTAVDRLNLGLCWAATGTVVAVVFRSRVSEGIRHLRTLRIRLDGVDWAMCGFIAALWFGTAIVAWAYPTTNYDSLTLHMARTIIWQQRGSVGFYPAWDAAQLFSSALPDYLILNVRVLLGGSDRLANMTQWVAFVLSSLAASLVAMRLGASRRGQQVAALCAATVPMAVLQASTSQDELTCALWVVAALYAAIALAQCIDADTSFKAGGWAIAFGVASALAVQSKASAYLALAACAVWVMVSVARTRTPKTIASLTLALVLSFVVLNAAWWTRNMQVLPWDPIAASAPTRGKHLARAQRPEQYATIAVKNLSWLVATPSPLANATLETVVRRTVAAYGGNIEDPATRWDDVHPYSVPRTISLRDHDTAPAPVVLLLFASCSVAILATKSQRSLEREWYIGVCVLALLLTSLFMTPQIFNNRIYLPALLALTPVVGVGWSVARRGWWRATLLALLFVAVAAGCISLAWNSRNPLVPLPPGVKLSSRPGYWAIAYDEARFSIAPTYREAATKIRDGARAAGVRSIGIREMGTGRFPIYPLLDELQGFRLGFVGRTVLPEQISDRNFHPDAIVEIDRNPSPADVVPSNPQRGRLIAEPTRVLDWTVLFYESP